MGLLDSLMLIFLNDFCILLKVCIAALSKPSPDDLIILALSGLFVSLISNSRMQKPDLKWLIKIESKYTGTTFYPY